MAAPANFAQELGAIDFGRVIGGPLVAAVEAHNMAQLTVADFIQSIGFIDTDNDGNPDEVRMVTFKYQREVTEPDPANPGNDRTVLKTFTFSVPFILLIRLPYFEVDSVDISLNVELTSVETRSTQSAFGINAEARVKHSWLVGSVNFKVNTSYSRTTKTGSRVERKYSYQVRVHAGVEEPPEGVNKLLDALVSLATEKEV
ncbi:MAG: DUF2589 domain-containing protein [Nitrospirae bacterium]|nr:MAG: DUF2589 domain-containing protein [Nitrospirota bacterium]